MLRAVFLILSLAMAGGAWAQGELRALARVDADVSRISDEGSGVAVHLELSQGVPWRAFTLADPARLVLDFREVLWPDALPVSSARVSAVRAGSYQPGWSRLVLMLDGPLAIDAAELTTKEAGAVLRVALREVSAEEFAARSGQPDTAGFEIERRPVVEAPTRRDRSGPLRVVLDPGHGGIDPGAEADGLVEADLMLRFARELREELIRAGGFEVLLSREEDIFVPLEARVRDARAAGADLFLSLHADAVTVDGDAVSGATVYVLAEEASDRASQQIAERHDQGDLLAGADLSGQGDEIALVLMDLARTETTPRTERLAAHLVEALAAHADGRNSRPLRSANFTVLRAPDIPSVLIEIGYLSSISDRKRLKSAEWRQTVAKDIRRALETWAAEDATIRAQARQ